MEQGPPAGSPCPHTLQALARSAYLGSAPHRPRGRCAWDGPCAYLACTWTHLDAWLLTKPGTIRRWRPHRCVRPYLPHPGRTRREHLFSGM